MKHNDNIIIFYRIRKYIKYIRNKCILMNIYILYQSKQVGGDVLISLLVHNVESFGNGFLCYC